MAATSTSTYIIRGGVAGRERLRVLSRVMGPMTVRLLERIGVLPGARCLDAGCGGGDVTLTLARMVGPAGAVVGVDIDDVKLDLARREAAEAGAGNVEYRRARIDELAADGTFDVAYSRFLLCHLPDPAAGLEHLVRAVRPGGVVAVQDIDYTGGFCHPPSRAYDASWDLYPRVAEHVGGDPRLGRRLPAMFAEAGLEGIGVHIEQPAGFDADTKLLTALTFEGIADTAVGAGLANAGDLDELLHELHAFAARPETMLTLPRMVQVWGRVPAAR
jgi:ubiquinone/menaquinone biosynthesis C-methylase UbiE